MAQYEIDRNGIAMGYSTQTSFEDIQLTLSTIIGYQIKALNSSNGVPATSSTLTVTSRDRCVTPAILQGLPESVSIPP